MNRRQIRNSFLPRVMVPIVAMAALLLLLPAPGHAATLNVTDDAHTKGTNTTKFGSKKVIKVDDNNSRVGFAKFDTSVLGPPDATTAASIAKATLRIFISKVKKAGDIDIDTVDADWSEGTITGDNAPTTTPIGALQGIGIAAADNNTFFLVNVDITPVVKGWVTTPATNFGIAILSDGARIEIDSKESKKTSHSMEIEVTHLAPGTEVGDLPGPNHPHGVITQIIGGGIGTGSLSIVADTNYVGMFHGNADDAPEPATSPMPLEGVVSDLHVLVETLSGSASDTFTFTILIDKVTGGGPGQGGAIADTLGPIECTIAGDDATPFTCDDKFITNAHSQCYKVGDGILVEVVTLDTPAATGMTWTAVFTPCECTAAACD